ncbi:RNA polymerase II-associated protein 3, partial [Physocladia obscura]
MGGKTNSSIDAALLVRANAEETRRQMQELLAWEKDIKSSTPSPSGTPDASIPVRGTKTAPTTTAAVPRPENPVVLLPYRDKSPEQLEVTLKQALILKEKGNAYFQRKVYVKAELEYSRAISLLDEYISQSSFQSSAVSTHLSTVLGNRAMTLIKLEKYPDAIADSSRILAHFDSKNIKALWRRAHASILLLESSISSNINLNDKDLLVEAKRDLEFALVLDPKNLLVKDDLVKVNAIIASKATTESTANAVTSKIPKNGLASGDPVSQKKSNSQLKKPSQRRRIDILEVGDAAAFFDKSASSKNLTEIIIAETPKAKSPVISKPEISNTIFKPEPAADNRVIIENNAAIKVKDKNEKAVHVNSSSTEKTTSKSFTSTMLKIVQSDSFASTETTTPVISPLNAKEKTMSRRIPLIVDLDAEKQVSKTKIEPESTGMTDLAVPSHSEIVKSKTQSSDVVTAALKLTPAPDTMFEFELEWKMRKSDDNNLYALIKLILPEKYRSLFKNSLEAHYVSKILQIFVLFYIPNESPQLLFDTLVALSEVERFAMNVLFFSSKDRAAVTQIFSFLRAKVGRDGSVFGVEDLYTVELREMAQGPINLAELPLQQLQAVKNQMEE